MTPDQIAIRTKAGLARSLAGGALMGLANLVPGISGGTMLLAVGVYPQCIEAVAKLATLRPDRNAVAVVAAVASSAALILLLLAGPVRDLVVGHRWVMYSIFLGSTLGGVPVLWRLMGRLDQSSVLGGIAGLALTVGTAAVPAVGSSALVLFLVGLGAFAAMLLPGLSGGYLLVLSGQYVPILDAVDGLKSAVLDFGGRQWLGLSESVRVLAPFAVGGLVALAGVSSLIRFLLRQQRSLILGFLLGLVAGAVLGLWPFSAEGSGSVIPSLGQGMAAICLTTAAFLGIRAIARLGDGDGDT